MIKSLRLGNFKAFADVQQIPIKPITLIFGANSAGKSSILHGLLLAHHAMQKNDLDVYHTMLGGESVDLGGFKQYVHRRDDHNRVLIATEFDAEALRQELGELVSDQKIIMVSTEIGLAQRETTQPNAVWNKEKKRIDWISVPTGEYETGDVPKVLSYEISTADGFIIRMSRRPDDTLQTDTVNTSHPLVRTLLESMILSFTTTGSVVESDWKIIDDVLGEIIPTIKASGLSFLPKSLELLEGEYGSSSQTIVPVSRASRQTDLASAMRFLIPRKIDELIRGVYRTMQEGFDRLLYLGPLRSYPERDLEFTKDRDPNWKAGGGYAYDLLLADEDLREAVNNWFADEKKLNKPYSIEVKKRYDLEDFVEAFKTKLSGKELEKLSNEIKHMLSQLQAKEKDAMTAEQLAQIKGLARILAPKLKEWDKEFPKEEAAKLEERLIPYAVALDFGYDIDELIDNYFEHLAEIASINLPSKKYLSLYDHQAKVKVSHRDVGVGISQVLPVLAYAYAHRGQTIAIEQPEIHLHPALQAELGDVFIESAMGERKNTFILETHSEHLILRMMRRIRETTAGTLPEGCTPLKCEDVSILYVEPDGSRSIVRQMELNPNGELVKAWPGGFFEEGLREVFA